MVKKKEKTGQVDDFFKQLIGEQNSVAAGAAVSGEEMFANVKMWLPSGSTVLDTTISNAEVGGWPCGRVVELYGPESIGKSTLAYQAMGECQKMGGIPIFFDVEQAGAESIMKACGVDMSRIIISRLTEVEDIFEVMEKNLTSIIGNPAYKDKPCVIVLDSLAQMSSRAEVEADYENNMHIMLTKAKQIGKALRKIVPFLMKANACLMIVNQTRDKPGISFGDPTETPGGKALKFAASVRLYLRGAASVKVMDPGMKAEYDKQIADWEEEIERWQDADKTGAKPSKPKKGDFKAEEVVVGYDVTAFTQKNKMSSPKRTAKFRIVFGAGIVEEQAWLEYTTKYGMVTKGSKGKHNFVDEKLDQEIGTFTKNDWLRVMKNGPVREQVRNFIVDKLIRPIEKDIDPADEIVKEIEEDKTESQD